MAAMLAHTACIVYDIIFNVERHGNNSMIILDTVTLLAYAIGGD
jgi:hypothetical protein